MLNDLFSLMVHLKPAPVVARVAATRTPRLRAPREDWLGLEIAVTTYLSERGAPVVAPSPELPPGPHEYDGFPISFWTYVEPDPDRTPTAADCSAMLVDLHDVLRSYPGELPMLCADDILRGLELLDQADDVLSDADVDLLRSSAERLRSLFGMRQRETYNRCTATPTPETSSPPAMAAWCGSTSKTYVSDPSNGTSRR